MLILARDIGNVLSSMLGLGFKVMLRLGLPLGFGLLLRLGLLLGTGLGLGLGLGEKSVNDP